MGGFLKSYQQYCPVAAGLDRLGDRWTLLILRDLAWYGPARFTELTRSNHGLPPALLSERLRRLVEDGLVQSTETGQYRLTERGTAVRPVIDSIAVFGGRLLLEDELTMDRLEYLAHRLTSLHAADLAGIAPVTIDFLVDGSSFAFTVSADGITVSDPGGSDLRVETDREGLFRLISGDSRALDEVSLHGDRRTLAEAVRFLTPSAA